MELSAIIVARVLAYIESFDLSPKGSIFYPELIKAIVENFQFQKFPQTFDQIDENKGVEFAMGLYRDQPIQKFTIFNTALLVETRSSTDDSAIILDEALNWAKKEFGIEYHPDMIKRWRYVSALTFRSDVAILDHINDPLKNLSLDVSKALHESVGVDLDYHPAAISISYDQLLRKYQIAPFSISRRADTPFAENKFYSEAPLPTHLHIQLLEKFERDLMKD